MANLGASLSPKEAEKLFRSWGFTLVRQNGGHVIWRAPSGDHFPMSITRISHIQISGAARLLGINSHQFLKGPGKKKK